MAWPYTKGEITNALVGKFAFEQDDRDHDFYVLTLDGRNVAYTYVSHGGRDRVTPKIAFRMMREMRLHNLQQFKDAVDCPLSPEEYYAQLRAEHAPPEPGPPEPARQPTRWVWTLSGKSFGYIQDAALYTYDGRNVGRLVGGGEDIYALDGTYLGEVRNWCGLVVDPAKAEWTDEPARPEPSLQAVHPWPDREPLLTDDLLDFPHPGAL
jgi:hypothetical protein